MLYSVSTREGKIESFVLEKKLKIWIVLHNLAII